MTKAGLVMDNLKRWQACFVGRRVGAIGVRYEIDAIVEAVDKEQAELKLYDRFEHISNLIIVEIPKEVNE